MAKRSARNLRIDRPQQDAVGLCYVLGEEACIETIYFERVQVQGRNNVGLVAGRRKDHITRIQLGNQEEGRLVVEG